MPRDGPVPDGEHRLDQTDHPGGGVQVADAGLHRAEHAVARTGRCAVRKARVSASISIASPIAVPLPCPSTKPTSVGCQSAAASASATTARLAGDPGRGEPGPVGAVVVHRPAGEHAVDVVVVGDRVGEPLEQDRAGAVAEHLAGGVRVVRPADPVGGERAAGPVPVAGLPGGHHRGAPGDRQVAPVVEQALRRLADRHQRRRAGGLHGDRRAGQAQRVRHPARQVVTGAAGQQVVPVLDQATGRTHGRVAEQVVTQVAVRGAAGEHADLGLRVRPAVAAVLERPPGDLEEQPVLRVQQGGVGGGVAEQRGVEVGEPGQATEGGHVAGVGGRPGGQPGLREFGGGEPPHRVDPVGEVGPELGRSLGAGHPAGQPDDRDPVVVVIYPSPLPAPDGGGASDRRRAAARRPPLPAR